MSAAAFHPDFGTRVNYAFESLPADPDSQVERTIARIIEYLIEDAQSPLIQDYARRAIEEGGGNPIQGVWNLVKRCVRFQHDEETADRLHINDPRKKDVVEVLIRPVDQALLIDLQGTGIEDCDGFEMFAGCLLYVLGIPCSLVTVSAAPEEPNRFTHVYIAAYPDGKRIPLDFSHGDYPGWECPNTGRLREWPIRAGTGSPLNAFLLAGGLIVAYVMLRRSRGTL
jgi:hypothetical protein